MRRRAGFTLVEAMVSIAVFGILSVGLYQLLEVGNSVYLRDSTLLLLGQQARNGMDSIVREVREGGVGTIGIVTVDADSDTLAFNTPNEAGIKYYRSGTRLVREYPLGTVKNVASNIVHLKFTRSGSLLTVDIQARANYYQGTMTFPLKAEVKLRNE